MSIAPKASYYHIKRGFFIGIINLLVFWIYLMNLNRHVKIKCYKFIIFDHDNNNPKFLWSQNFEIDKYINIYLTRYNYIKLITCYLLVICIYFLKKEILSTSILYSMWNLVITKFWFKNKKKKLILCFNMVIKPCLISPQAQVVHLLLMEQCKSSDHFVYSVMAKHFLQMNLHGIKV